MPERKKRTTPKRETPRVESTASGPLLPEQQEIPPAPASSGSKRRADRLGTGQPVEKCL